MAQFILALEFSFSLFLFFFSLADSSDWADLWGKSLASLHPGPQSTPSYATLA